MWFRIESQSKSCACGGVAEKWVLLAGGKCLASVAFCPLCHPRLAALVERSGSLVPQGEDDRREYGAVLRG